MSSSRRSSKATLPESEFIYECKAAYTFVLSSIKREIQSKNELLEVLQTTGRNPSQKTLNKYWKSNTDSLTFDDFCDICKKEPLTTADDLKKAFRKIDINGDGFISLDELFKMMTTKGEKMSREEVRQMLDEVDENGDGKLDYDEFCVLMSATTEDCRKQARKTYERKERHRRTEQFAENKKEVDLGSTPSVRSIRSNASVSKHEATASGARSSRQNSRISVRDEAVETKSEIKDEEEPTPKQSRSGSVLSISKDVATTGSRRNSTISVREESARSKNTSRANSSVSVKDYNTTPTPSRQGSQIFKKNEEEACNKSPDEHISAEKEKTTPTPSRQGSQVSVRSEVKKSSSRKNSVTAEMSSLRRTSVSTEVSASRRNSVAGEASSKEEGEHIAATECENTIQSEREMSEDVPKPSPRTKVKTKQSPAASLPALPKYRKTADHLHSKGCFFLDDEDGLISHQYQLKMKKESEVFITIEPAETKNLILSTENHPVDTALFILRDDPDGGSQTLVGVTEQRDGKGKYGIKLNLEAGRYTLLPFTTCCRLKERTADISKEVALVKKNKDGKNVITKLFRRALEEIFDLCDLDGNGFLSKDEFSWFNLRTSGEMLKDDEWKVVEENAELDNGELTKEGFISLNEMEAEDADDDIDDLWVTLSSMGYNKELYIDEACPFIINIYTEENRAAIMKVKTIDKLNENVVMDSIVEKGEMTKVKGMKDLYMYTYMSSTRASILVENKSYSKVKMQLDCSSSKNCISNRESLQHVITLKSQGREIAHHLIPADESLDWSVQCNEIILK